MLAKSGQKTALAGDWPKAIASQGWLNEGRRRGDIASASPAPMTDIANILRRNGQFSSGTSLHSVKQAPACWGLRPQSPKREASADKATAAPHVAAALCQAQGWLPRISPILNVPSPADWRNLDATAVLIARPSPKLPRGPETLAATQTPCQASSGSLAYLRSEKRYAVKPGALGSVNLEVASLADGVLEPRDTVQRASTFRQRLTSFWPEWPRSAENVADSLRDADLQRIGG